VGVENIFKFFRVDAIWRLTYLDNPDVLPFGIFVKMQIQFYYATPTRKVVICFFISTILLFLSNFTQLFSFQKLFIYMERTNKPWCQKINIIQRDLRKVKLFTSQSLISIEKRGEYLGHII
jgi:hypothetical protein